MIEVREAGTHMPRIRATGPMYTARCPDCGWVRHYESIREAEFFADVHCKRLGQIPGQLTFA